MKGWKIFTHSVRMVFGNLGSALRISGLIYGVYIIVNVYFTLNFSDDLRVLALNMEKGHMPMQLPSGLVGMMLLNLVTALLTSLWIAVLWHRYVLLEENPRTFIPPLYAGVIAAYLGKTIQLALILGAVGIALGLVFGLLLGQFAAAIIPLLLLGVLLYLSYRFGLVMPAVALSNPLTFKTSWEKTKPAAGAIAQLAGIAVVFAIIIQIPSNMNPDPTSFINLVYSYVMEWISMMVGVSVLTTLYGIYVEGREL